MLLIDLLAMLPELLSVCFSVSINRIYTIPMKSWLFLERRPSTSQINCYLNHETPAHFITKINPLLHPLHPPPSPHPHLLYLATY
jgi:hypothetical protein